MNIKLLLGIGVALIIGLLMFPIVKIATDDAYTESIREGLVSSVNVGMTGIATKTGTATFTTATIINEVTDFGNFTINCAPATSGSVCANYTISGNTVIIKANSTFQNGTYSVEANIDTGDNTTGNTLLNLIPFFYILIVISGAIAGGYFAIKE